MKLSTLLTTAFFLSTLVLLSSPAFAGSELGMPEGQPLGKDAQVFIEGHEGMIAVFGSSAKAIYRAMDVNPNSDGEKVIGRTSCGEIQIPHGGSVFGCMIPLFETK